MNTAAAPTSKRVKPGENPFRSGRVDALEYRPVGSSWEKIEKRLADCRFRGALVGPHGHGKSTLMWQIGQRYASRANQLAGVEDGGFSYFQIKPEDREQPAALRAAIREYPRLLLIDGYDMLSWRDRVRVVFRAKPTLVTSHRRTPLATLLVCRTTPGLLGDLVERLSPEVRGLLGDKHIAELHEGHGGNVRNALRELYDLVAAGEFHI